MSEREVRGGNGERIGIIFGIIAIVFGFAGMAYSEDRGRLFGLLGALLGISDIILVLCAITIIVYHI